MRETRSTRRAARGGPLVRRQCGPPGANCLEGVPERGLAGVSSSDESMSGTTSASIVGVKRWTSPSVASRGRASGKSSPFRNSSASRPSRRRASARRCEARGGAIARERQIQPANLTQFVPYTSDRVDVRRCSDLIIALPARPWNARPSRSSGACAPYLSRNMSRADARSAGRGAPSAAPRSRVKAVDLGDRLVEIPLVDVVGRHGGTGSTGPSLLS